MRIITITAVRTRRAGDVVVIPASVAHKNEGASPDLVVVGAYPRGQSPDMRSPGVADHARALPRIAAVPLPAGDPVHGNSGPLIERWRRRTRLTNDLWTALPARYRQRPV